MYNKEVDKDSNREGSVTESSINKYTSKHYLYRLPLYSIWVLYVLKRYKFPYFMYFAEYNLDRRIKQAFLLAAGFAFINIGFNIYSIINSPITANSSDTSTK